MLRRNLSGLAVLALLLPLALAGPSFAHERKEVAGMMVIFGAEAGGAEQHEVSFDFRIGDRQQMTLPPQAAAADASSTDGSAAAAVVAAFHAALAAGDGDEALSHLAPDVIIFESGGAEMSRDEYASHHLGGDMRFAAGVQRETLDQTTESFGDTAYVLTRSRTTGSFGDRAIDSMGVESMVLRHSDGTWRIVHIHWSSRRSPQQ